MGSRRLSRRRYRSGSSLVALALAAAIPVLLFGGWAAYVTAQRQLDLARRAAATSVTRVAERVASEIATQVQLLQILALSASLDEPDLSIFYREAARAKQAHPLWETVELSDPNGIQVLNLLRPLNDRLGPTADRRSFERAVATQKPFVGGIGPRGPVSDKRLVAIRVPVLRLGTLRYILSIGLATTAVSKILMQAGAPQGGIGVVVDDDGTIIARTEGEERELGRQASRSLREAIARAPEGTYMGTSLEGARVEVVYRTLAGTNGWSVHVGLPVARLNAPIVRSYTVLGGGAVVSVALAIALAGLVTRDMARLRRGEEARMTLALRMSQEQEAAAVEAAELGTLRWDLDRGRVAGSQRTRTLLGLPSDGALADADWRARDVFADVHDDDRQRLRAALRHCGRDGTSLDVEFRVLSPDRTGRWVRMTGRVPRLHGASARVIYGVVADIEPAKRVEAERIEFLRQLGAAQENEQRRIARELHDQVGQTVTGLSLGLKTLDAVLDGDAPEQARGHVAWLQDLAVEIGRDLHRAAVDLRPTALDDLGLREALETLLRQWTQRHGIAADLQYLGDDARLAPEIETALYRIAQEALTNVHKHAGARNVCLIVERHAGEVRIVIEDDGAGFDPDTLATAGTPEHGGVPKPRLGLSGIRERLALLRGSLSVESVEGAGTTLFIRIPIPTAALEGADHGTPGDGTTA